MGSVTASFVFQLVNYDFNWQYQKFDDSVSFRKIFQLMYVTEA